MDVASDDRDHRHHCVAGSYGIHRGEPIHRRGYAAQILGAGNQENRAGDGSHRMAHTNHDDGPAPGVCHRARQAAEWHGVRGLGACAGRGNLGCSALRGAGDSLW